MNTCYMAKDREGGCIIINNDSWRSRGLRALYLGQEQDMTSHLHRTFNGHK